MSISRTSSELAEMVNGTLVGDPDVTVTGVSSLMEANPTDISFLGNPKYHDKVVPSRAGVVLVPTDFEEAPPEGRAWIVCDDPSMAFAKIVGTYAPPPPEYAPGAHTSAVVDPTADVADSAHIGPCAVVAAHAVVGANSVVGAGAYVGEHARVGSDCLLYPNVTIRERCVLGDRVVIHPGSTVGSDGFGYIPGPQGHTKIPQVGIVQIDDDVEIGALVAIDRARFGRTWIKRGAKIDNLVQIAHNVVIGEHCFIIAQVGISGSSRVGDGSVLAGQVGVAGHLDIGSRVTAAAKAGISKDIPDNSTVIGAPAVDKQRFLKQQMALHRLERFQKLVRELQAEVADLKAKLHEE